MMKKILLAVFLFASASANAGVSGVGTIDIAHTCISCNIVGGTATGVAGVGDVTGPAGTVADDIAIYNGATGLIIKDGGKKITDLVPYTGATTAPDMNGKQIKNAAAGTVASDVAIISQLSAGVTWLSPISVPYMHDDSLVAPPGTCVVETAYIAAATSGAWTAGHIYECLTAAPTWTDIGLVSTGTRVGINFNAGTVAAGSFAGKDGYTCTITGGTPGAYTYSCAAPAAGNQVFVDGAPNSVGVDFTHIYWYSGTVWIDTQGGASSNPLAGRGLKYSGNTLLIDELITMALDSAQTITGIKTFTNSTVKLLGSSTGATTFTSDNAGATNYTAHVPAANDTLVENGGCTYASNNFRIGGSSAAIPTAGVFAATSIFLNQINGGCIGLYSGTSWVVDTSTGTSLALGTLTNNRVYDVFAFDNAGVVTLETLAWTDNTTRATALTTQDGIFVKTGATTRRYVGSFLAAGNSAATATITIAAPGVVTRTAHGLACNAPVVFTTTGALPTGITASTTYYVSCAGAAGIDGILTVNTFMVAAAPGGPPLPTTGTQSGTHTATVSTYTEDSEQNRYVFNYYNRVRRVMNTLSLSANYTYTSFTLRECNASLGNQLNFVVGVSDDIFSVSNWQRRGNSTANVGTYGAIGLDSITASMTIPSSFGYLYVPIANAYKPDTAWVNTYPGVGLHYFSCEEMSDATGSTLWSPNSSLLNATFGD